MRLSAYLLFTIVCLSNHTQAAPIDLPNWLGPLLPVKGVSLRDEIICYSLPYGGIGFLSHLLTYWAIFVLGHGRKPYAPWSKLSAGKIDLCLSLVQIVISVLIASFTISRCRDRWQFVLIAVWKLVLSVEVGIWGISASLKAMEHNKQKEGYVPVHLYNTVKKIWDTDDWTPYTLVLYVAAYIVGIAGLGSIVWTLRHDQNIQYITYAFCAATASIIFVCMMLWCCCGCVEAISRWKLFLAMASSVIMVGALYSDWILGDIAGSLVGIPSGDTELYWAYFIAKRLPLLMS